jgi:hypothetical protein
VNIKLFKAFKTGKQAQNGLIPPGVTREVILEDCRIKKGVVKGDEQPFLLVVTTMFGRKFTTSIFGSWMKGGLTK